MSTDVAIKHIAIQSIRNMKEDDAGGGNGGGRNELKLKRKSNESIPEIGGKKMKKQWKTIRRKKLKGKKISKKPGSPDGDKPSSGTKKVTTTTAPSSGGTGKRRRRRMTESFNAPFNSTQFLMNDHKTEAVKHLDSTLNGGNNGGKGRKNEVNVDEDDSVDITMEERPLRRITRARESSFSIDSDDDYYYSSPEDEEEFMSREFMKDYDNLRNDRLIDLSKDELINEYLQMEEKIEALEKRLSRQSSSTNTDVANVAATDQNENENDDTNSKEAMADTILQFQKEIQRLESENDQLKLTSTQNAAVPTPATGCSSSCSSSSESDDSESESDSDSDDSSESDSDNGEEEVTFKQVISGEKKLSSKPAEKGLEMDCEVEGDTGYESGHSNKPVHPVTNNTTGTTEGGINPNEEKEVVVNGNLTENGQKDENEDSGDDLESETESCPELISVNCITSTSP